MPVEFICEGCGKRAPGVRANGRWFKPHLWYEIGWDAKDTHVACSRECVKKIGGPFAPW